MLKSSIVAIALVVTIWAPPGIAQQRADLEFEHHIERAAFEPGHGPSVAIDAGHYNYHTAIGRYKPFADLLSADGFRIASLAGQLDAGALAGIDILVIANALNAANDDNWILPTPSAFSPEEIEAVGIWIEEGGSLLLIADHMPFAGAAKEMAAAFDFGFINGYAARVADRSTNFAFAPDNGLNLKPLGELGLPPTDRVVTFTGQAFTVPAEASSLLNLVGPHAALLPSVAGEFSASTPFIVVTGYSQGAIREFGRGRVAVFGEAAAFTAQLSRTGGRMGMNAPGAEANASFVLKVLRWLARYQPS
jgi:hypothetical protein